MAGRRDRHAERHRLHLSGQRQHADSDPGIDAMVRFARGLHLSGRGSGRGDELQLRAFHLRPGHRQRIRLHEHDFRLGRARRHSDARQLHPAGECPVRRRGRGRHVACLRLGQRVADSRRHRRARRRRRRRDNAGHGNRPRRGEGRHGASSDFIQRHGYSRLVGQPTRPVCIRGSPRHDASGHRQRYDGAQGSDRRAHRRQLAGAGAEPRSKWTALSSATLPAPARSASRWSRTTGPTWPEQLCCRWSRGRMPA